MREVEVYGVSSLADAVGIVTGLGDLDPVSPAADEVEGKLNKYDIDFSDVKGQEFAKRAANPRRLWERVTRILPDFLLLGELPPTSTRDVGPPSTDTRPGGDDLVREIKQLVTSAGSQAAV